MLNAAYWYRFSSKQISKPTAQDVEVSMRDFHDTAERERASQRKGAHTRTER